MRTRSRVSPRQAPPSGIDSAALISGVFSGLALSVAASILIAIVIHYTALTESRLPLVATAVGLASMFLAGLWAAREASSGVLIHGVLAALIYALLTSLISAIFLPGVGGAVIIRNLALAVPAGAIGGVVGVNL